MEEKRNKLMKKVEELSVKVNELTLQWKTEGFVITKTISFYIENNENEIKKNENRIIVISEGPNI